MLPGAGVGGEDPRANQDRVVRVLFMAWIIYSLLWHAPDPEDVRLSSGGMPELNVVTDVTGRPLRNLQLFRNATSPIALVSLFVVNGDKERLASALQLSDAIVHRATPFRRMHGAEAAFYGHASPLSATAFAAQFLPLRSRIATSLRTLTPLNVWALLFKAELGTDINCIGVCEQGNDRHCVGVPDLYNEKRCWMPIDDQCAVDNGDRPHDRSRDCYVLHSVFPRRLAQDNPAVAADMHFRWFANRTCELESAACDEPIPRLRGDVARAVMYGELAYGTSQSVDEWLRAVPRVYFGWAQSDPVDDIERRRNELLYAAQQTRNPFVDFDLSGVWRRDEQ
jgi:hypothetical protein